MPKFKFSEEARRFLLATTYGRGFPHSADRSRIPFVLWTFNTSRIGAAGFSVEEWGPRYQLFTGPVTDFASELLAELDAGKPIAFRLDPAMPQAASYFVSLDDDRLSIRPE